jgi:hypothetical protein
MLKAKGEIASAHPYQIGIRCSICRWTEKLAGTKDNVALARFSLHKTTMSLKWIAKRFNTGAAGSSAIPLRDTRRKQYYAKTQECRGCVDNRIFGEN